MARVSMIDPENASPEVKQAIEEHLAQGYKLTNEKKTLLHNVEAFKAVEVGSYAVDRELAKIVGSRAADFFEYAVSVQNECLVCTTYFGKLLKEHGIDPANFEFTEEEKLLMQFGQAMAADPKHIPEELYEGLKARYTDAEIVVITAMGCMMIANNYFNDVMDVDI